MPSFFYNTAILHILNWNKIRDPIVIKEIEYESRHRQAWFAIKLILFKYIALHIIEYYLDNVRGYRKGRNALHTARLYTVQLSQLMPVFHWLKWFHDYEEIVEKWYIEC